MNSSYTLLFNKTKCHESISSGWLSSNRVYDCLIHNIICKVNEQRVTHWTKDFLSLSLSFSLGIYAQGTRVLQKRGNATARVSEWSPRDMVLVPRIEEYLSRERSLFATRPPLERSFSFILVFFRRSLYFERALGTLPLVLFVSHPLFFIFFLLYPLASSSSTLSSRNQNAKKKDECFSMFIYMYWTVWMCGVCEPATPGFWPTVFGIPFRLLLLLHHRRLPLPLGGMPTARSLGSLETGGRRWDCV